MATYAGSNDSAGPNHCDPCFILDNIKVDSSSLCRECRHQLCDGCVEHHRRTLATRDHAIITFQHTETSRTPVNDQQSNRSGQCGTELKLGAHLSFKGSHVGTEGKSAFEVCGRRAQHDTRFVLGNMVDIQSDIPGQSETPRYEVSERGVTGSDSVDHDQIELEVDGRLVRDEYQATGSDSLDQDQNVKSSMKNMRLDAGTSNTQTTRQTGKPYTTITLKHSLNVERENDRYYCDITGLVMLQDKLIVCDYGNSKLKVYDSSYSFLYEYKCDYNPWDIALLDVDTVVVSFMANNIRLLSVKNDSMKEIRKINTEHWCGGICCFEGNIYCVVGGREVRVYTPLGQLESKLAHLSDGKVECNDLRYITVNPQTGILYVTDWDKDVVLALSTSGDVISVMCPPHLKDIEGVVVDDHGHIYACGSFSNNIIKMSSDGQKSIEVLSGKDKCEDPHCVKIYGNKMFVSHCDLNSSDDEIAIYQLS